MSVFSFRASGTSMQVRTMRCVVHSHDEEFSILNGDIHGRALNRDAAPRYSLYFHVSDIGLR